MKVNISAYSGSVVGGDWSLAFTAAWNAVKATGGTIYIDQTITLKTQVVMNTHNCPLVIEGDGASQIIIASPAAAATLNFGSLSMLTLSKLLVTGDGTSGPGSTTDMQNVVLIAFVGRTIIEKCMFVGLKGVRVFQILGDTSVVIRDCILSGNAASTVDVELAHSILIENCDFLDYAYIAGGSYIKSPEGASWVKISNPPPGVVGANQSKIKIINCRLDEASNNGLEIEDYPQAEIDGCSVNLKSIGFKFTNVKRPTLKNCHVGYNNVPANPMAQFNNCQYPVVIGLTTDDNALAHPNKIEVTADFAANLKKLHCSDDVTVEVI